MKKLLMMIAFAGFMTAGLTNSFAQDDPAKKKTKTEQPDGTMNKEKNKKDGTVKEKQKNPDGTVNKSKTYQDGTVKDKEKQKSSSY